MNILTKQITIIVAAVIAILSGASCNNQKSYAQLLTEETHSANAFLANFRVEYDIPADSIFKTVEEYGDKAPFYRMDPDGLVYMQVVEAGDRKNNKAEDNQEIYFRFMRVNLNDLYNLGYATPEGNADNMEYTPFMFRFNNYTLSSSAQYGAGVQTPLYFLGIDCRVNLLIKSQAGFSGEISKAIPYFYENVRYFKSQI